MTPFNRVLNVLGVVSSHERIRWRPAALLAPLAIWLASAAAVTLAQDEKPTKEEKLTKEEKPTPPVQDGGTFGGLVRRITEGKYTASACLRVAMQEKPILSPTEFRGIDRDRFDIYKNTQQQLLVSRFVLQAALRTPEVNKLASVQREQATGDPVKWLAGRLSVSFPGRAEIMQVSLSGDDPKEATTLVNAVVNAYLAEVVNAERDQKRQRLSELDRAYVEKETDIRNKREELKKLAQVQGSTEVANLEHAAAVKELTRCQEEMGEIRAEMRMYKGQVAQLKASPNDASDQIRSYEGLIAAKTEQQKELEKDIQQARKEVEKFDASSVDIEMMRADIKNLDAVLTGIATEREKLRVECRATPRVTLLQRAEATEN